LPVSLPRFPLRSAIYLKKVCYKVSLCEYCQRQICKAFTGLPNRAKMVSGGRPLLLQTFAETDHPLQNGRFPLIFARSVSAVTPSEKVQLTQEVHYGLSNEPKMNSVRCP